MVIVDVEDRDRAEAAAVRLARRDRGVVEVAIAAHIIAPGMMAGRTAEREGMARVAAGQLVERRERALRRPIGRFPCSRRDRRSEEHTSELQSLMRISYAVFCLK